MNCEMCGLPLFSGASGYLGPMCKCGWREIHPINSVDSRNRIATLEAEVAALRQQVEGMREDAERYRWLVENSFDIEGVTQFHIWWHEWEPHSKTGEPTVWKSRVRGPSIDAAIDAARKESSK